MRFSLVLLLLSGQTFGAEPLPTKVPPDLIQECRLSLEDVKLVEHCLEQFNEHECYTYPMEPEVQEKMATCNIYELRGGSSGTDFLKLCKNQVVNSYKDLWTVITGLPAMISSAVNNPTVVKLNRQAQEVCSERLNVQTKDMVVLPHQSKNQIHLNWSGCVQDEFSRLYKAKGMDLPGKPDMTAFFKELHKGLSCFKPVHWPALACPIVTDAVVSGVVGGSAKFVAREALSKASTRFGPWLKKFPKLAREVDKYLDDLEIRAQPPKEKLSVKHQQDLIAMSQSKYLSEVIERAQLKREPLMLGMADSDVGKLTSEWSRNVLDNSPAADELIGMLARRGDSPAAKAFAELMDSNPAFKGKSFFPSNYTNQEIREVIRQNPAFQQYLHEAPGMRKAIAALDSNLQNGSLAGSPVNNFQDRIAANLGHNGPPKGFMETFDTVIMPGAMKNGDDKVKNFFKGTIFEGDKTPEGVIKPKYIYPMSPEGVFHTLIDRMSQGTRGGMKKIFAEVGGKPLAENPKLALKDMSFLKSDINYEMLVSNPERTLVQLGDLKRHVLESTAWPASQKSILKEAIEVGEERLETQLRYIRDGKRIKKLSDGNYQITLQEPGKPPTFHPLTPDTPSDEAADLMEKLMLQEERINGNPVTSLGAPPQRGSFYARDMRGSAIRGGALAATTVDALPNSKDSSSIQLTRGLCQPPRESFPTPGESSRGVIEGP